MRTGAPCRRIGDRKFRVDASIPSLRSSGVRIITAFPQRTVYPVSPTQLHPQALGAAAVGGTPERKHNKARNRLRGKDFMVSPAGFEPATPGVEEPHSGVYGDASMLYNPYRSPIPGFRSIYAVAPKTPVPWRRGDGFDLSHPQPNNVRIGGSTIMTIRTMKPGHRSPKGPLNADFCAS